MCIYIHLSTPTPALAYTDTQPWSSPAFLGNLFKCYFVGPVQPSRTQPEDSDTSNH